MQEANAGCNGSAIDQTRSALDFVHRLLAVPELDVWPLERLLNELRAAFHARGAGLAGPSEGTFAVQQRIAIQGTSPTEEPLPWKVRPELLQEISRARNALAVR